MYLTCTSARLWNHLNVYKRIHVYKRIRCCSSSRKHLQRVVRLCEAIHTVYFVHSNKQITRAHSGYDTIQILWMCMLLVYDSLCFCIFELMRCRPTIVMTPLKSDCCICFCIWFLMFLFVYSSFMRCLWNSAMTPFRYDGCMCLCEWFLIYIFKLNAMSIKHCNDAIL